METSALNTQPLASRYRRLWERSLKQLIRKANDKTYAAAMYLSLLKTYEMFLLKNPFLAALWKDFINCEKLGYTEEEFMSHARTLRDSNRRQMQEEHTEAGGQAIEILPAEELKQENATEAQTAIFIESHFSAYGLFAHYLTDEGDKPLFHFIIRMKTLRGLAAKLASDHDLTDANLVTILNPEVSFVTGEALTPSNGTENKETIHSVQSIPAAQNGTEEIMNAEQAAEFLHIAMPTLYEKTSKGIIPHSKPSGKLLFHRSELVQWVKEGRKHTREDAEQLAFEQMRKLNKKRK